MYPTAKSGNRVLNALLALAVGTGLHPTAQAQIIQQGAKLVGTGALGGAGQGFSAALSGDGNTAIVGGYLDNNVDGAAWVYTRSGGVWSQQGGKLVGTGAVYIAANQGHSVALSADGNTAIVSGHVDNDRVGAAWVYTRAGGAWSQQGAKLVGTGAAGKAFQGASVALSGDGNTALVGGPEDNGQVGAAWVYTRAGGVWSQLGGKLVGTSAVGPYCSQGSSVALSADGNTAIVGAPGDNGYAGAAWVYTRAGGVWSQQGEKLVGTGAVAGGGYGAFQGQSVALSGDGNTAVVGGYADNGLAGAVWVYTRSGGVWSQQGGKLVGTGAVGIASQGKSVALSWDGNTAIVGGDGDNGHAGAAWVYTRLGGAWSQLGGKLVGNGAVGPAHQGFAVALSGDGNTAMVGGWSDNSYAGAAWVFAISGPSPSIALGGVTNGASFLPGIAPGTWITIQGANLSATTRTWGSADFSGNKLPSQLDGVSVTVNGKPAYVYFISPTQLNVLAPEDATLGPVPIQVMTRQGKSNVVNAVEAALSPALFTFSAQGGSYVAAVRADGTYIGPALPAKPGDTILLFGTGVGPTTPPSPIGQLVNPALLANQVIVRIGGIAADTQFAGLVSPGLYQFNVVVPSVPDGDNAVRVEIGGGFSQANVFLTIQR